MLTATETDGTITKHGQLVLVKWDAKSPNFQTYLEKARALKTSTKSPGYNKTLQGWLFHPTATHTILNTFPTLTAHPDVLKTTVKQITTTVDTTPVRQIDAQDHQLVVTWNNTTKGEFEAFLKAAKSIPDGTYNGKSWVYPTTHAAHVRNAFPGFAWTGNALDATLDTTYTLLHDDQQAEALTTAAQFILNQPLPSGRTLFPHQHHGVLYLAQHRNHATNGHRPKGAIIGDDMGLGKTTTALIIAKAHQHLDPHTRVIVIAPKAVARNWRTEATACGTPVTVYKWSDMPANISGPYVLIADEAHFAQDMDSARTKRFLALAKHASTVYPVTGTPLKNGRPINLLPLLVAIDHYIAQDTDKYELTFCNARWENVSVRDDKDGSRSNRRVWKNDEAINLKTLYTLTSPNILRRLKKDCLDLPPKLRSLVDADASPAAQAHYDNTLQHLRAEYRRRLDADTIKGTAGALVLLNNLRHAAELAKVPTVIDLAQEALDNNDQPVLFFEFADAAQQVADHFGVPLFDGQASEGKRNRIIDNFQNGTQPVFVGMRAAGGVGITLTAGRTVILASRPWTPGDAVQVEDRCHRIGQTGTVNAYWVQFGYIDEKVDAVLVEKEGNIQEALTGQRSTLTFNENALAEEIADALLAA